VEKSREEFKILSPPLSHLKSSSACKSHLSWILVGSRRKRKSLEASKFVEGLQDCCKGLEVTLKAYLK
jgi:hypothetical protein